MSDSQEKLVQLLSLNEQNLAALSCLNDIFEGNAQFKRTDYPPFLTRQILRDYKIRHEIDNELSSTEKHTEGYNELIAGLEKLTDNTLNINTVAALKGDYDHWVFTSNDSTKLVGVLKIPHRERSLEPVS